MTRIPAVLAALCALALPLSAARAADVTLTPAIQQHLGIATQPLVATRRAGEIDAFAKVLDPGPLAQLVADLRTAEAAAVASRAEADRARTLNRSEGAVSSRDLETATALAASDALKVTALRRRLGLEWGPGLARMSDAGRDQLVRALADGSAALVHVDTHNNDGQTGARRVKIDIGPDSVTGTVIGPARSAEPRLQSSGLIVKVTGKAAILLSIGLTQSAHIESTSLQDGFIIPRAALIRFRGSDWVYVRSAPTRFERRMVMNPTPQENGFFVGGGFVRTDAVVVEGAAALFAVEQSASTGSR